MKTSFNERGNFLANEYWNFKEKVGSTVNEKTRLEEIEKLLSKGIGGKLGSRLEKEANELRRIIEEKRTAAHNLAAVRRDLLDLISDFAPSLDVRSGTIFSYDTHPLNEDYFRAVTDIFFGEPKISIELKSAIFSKDGIQIPGTTDDFTALKSLSYATMIIQEAAKKLLGRENILDRYWKRMREREFGVIGFGVLVASDRPLTLKEVEKICNVRDEDYRRLVHDVYDKRLRADMEYLASNRWEYPPVERVGEKYQVTDIGKWIWMLCKEREVEKEEVSRAKRIYDFFIRFRRKWKKLF
jgi:hypothetical protein